MSEALNQKFVYIPRSALIASLCLHIAFPVAWLIDKGLEKLGLHLIPQSKKISTKDLYQNYIQVDVVALPDQLMNDRTSVDTTQPIVEKAAVAPELKPETKDAMKEPETKAEAEKKAAEEKEMSEQAAKEKKKQEAKKKEDEKKLAKEKEKEKKKDDEKTRKKAEAEAMKKVQEQADREAALKGLAKSGKKGRGKLAGNKTSKGTAMSGMIGTAKDAYTAQVAQKIREHFNIFPWQKKKNLSASVYIEIFPNGRLKEKKLMKASKDSVYDAAVLQAVEESQPLPIPEDMGLVADGITLEFKPEN